MTDPMIPVQVGELVPDLDVPVYLPESNDVGSIRLKDLQTAGKWTILFFYPADFTFV